MLEAGRKGAPGCGFYPSLLPKDWRPSSTSLSHPYLQSHLDYSNPTSESAPRTSPTQPAIPGYSLSHIVLLASLLFRPWCWIPPITNHTEPVRRLSKQPGGSGPPRSHCCVRASSATLHFLSTKFFSSNPDHYLKINQVSLKILRVSCLDQL